MAKFAVSSTSWVSKLRRDSFHGKGMGKARPPVSPIRPLPFPIPFPRMFIVLGRPGTCCHPKRHCLPNKMFHGFGRMEAINRMPPTKTLPPHLSFHSVGKGERPSRACHPKFPCLFPPFPFIEGGQASVVTQRPNASLIFTLAESGGHRRDVTLHDFASTFHQ